MVENENASKLSPIGRNQRQMQRLCPIEKVSGNGAAYHKSCFKCSHGGCTISPSNYIAHEGVLFCKHHHQQLIMNKGKPKPPRPATSPSRD